MRRTYGSVVDRLRNRASCALRWRMRLEAESKIINGGHGKKRGGKTKPFDHGGPEEVPGQSFNHKSHEGALREPRHCGNGRLLPALRQGIITSTHLLRTFIPVILQWRVLPRATSVCDLALRPGRPSNYPYRSQAFEEGQSSSHRWCAMGRRR